MSQSSEQLFRGKSIDAIASAIQIPDLAYDKAKARYEDLGAWFDREESTCKVHAPHIYPQGSFRLGTVVKPLNEDGEFDLDLGCRLRLGIAKSSHTQEQLKIKVGKELESYRKARGIENELDEKHRCWRLEYQDELNFHMDVVPSIPELQARRALLVEAMVKGGADRTLADSVAIHEGAITDNRDHNFRHITPDWRISNSEGYSLWFESRIKQAKLLMELLAKAKIDKLPERQRQSPLQKCVQVLKRHRDVMFEKNPASKPISIVITTLAALAYTGEEDVDSAMHIIVEGMGKFVRGSTPRVSNPVNPVEDFADKWSTEEGKTLKLEESFWKWLEEARNDFSQLQTSGDVLLLEAKASQKFRTSLNKETLTTMARTNGLLSKATQLSVGARTSTIGVIGAAGVSNQPHKFFGK